MKQDVFPNTTRPPGIEAKGFIPDLPDNGPMTPQAKRAVWLVAGLTGLCIAGSLLAPWVR